MTEREDFESWWGASKYMQVVYAGESAKQTAWDAWQAGVAAGMEKAAVVCEGKREVMKFKTNNIPLEVKGYNNGVMDCVEAIRKEMK